MPKLPEMTDEEKAAYNKALARIEACQRQGKQGTVLDLGRIRLTSLPPEIGQLSALKLLVLFNNQLSSLPPEIGQLSALTQFVLYDNQLTSLPPEIGQLSALTQLYLFDNQLTSLPPEIGQLSALTLLGLSRNQLTSLPPEIGQLSALTELDLCNNQLTSLPPEIGQLSALRQLDLRANQFTSLPPEIGQLSALTELNLRANQLTSLPLEIGQLSALTQLYLNDNQLKSLPPEIGQLSALTLLVLSNNQLTSLPPEIGQLSNLTHLFLHGNPGLNIPDSVLGPTINEVFGPDAKQSKSAANPADILNFYFAQRQAVSAGSAVAVGAIKVMLVGRGGAGKTSVRRFLMGENHDKGEKETPGIALKDCPLVCDGKKVIAHLWDFAGQEITHALHQFFLTEGCVYLLVLDPRSDTEWGDALYWMGLLKRYAEGAPVIVVLNRQDARGEGGYDIDRARLREKFPQVIQGFVRTNCETRQGCQELKALLCQAIQALPAAGPPHLMVPEAWLAIKEECFRQGQPARNGKPGARRTHLSLEEFRAICAGHDEQDAQKQESLARLLHSLGAVLYFANDERLRDTTVLSPHWVTDSVYRLLRFKESAHSDGVLTLADAMAALKGETEMAVRYLLRLMERFEMCLPLATQPAQASTSWLVPGALGKFQPEALDVTPFQGTEAVRMRYVYDPLPEGVIPRLIVVTHLLSEPKGRWRYGIVLAEGGARALVRRGEKMNHLEIAAIGPPAERLRLLEVIQGHLDRINATVPDPKPYAEQELAGLPGSYHTLKNLTDVEKLEKATGHKQPFIVTLADGRVAQVEPTPQLDRTSEESSRDPEREPIPLFLSYSDKDRRAKDEFLLNLAAMSSKRLITTWHDNLMEPGTLWRAEIQEKLDSMGIFVGLLTNAFMTSEFIQEVEMVAAQKKLKQGQGFLLVLILVDDIPLEGFKFTDDHQILKPGKKAVRKHKNLRDGFNQAQRELEALILARQQELKAWRGDSITKENLERMPGAAAPLPLAQGVTIVSIQGDNYGIAGSGSRQAVRGSFNKGPARPANTPKQATQLPPQEALRAEVEAILPGLPEDEAAEVAGNLEVLIMQASAPKPSRRLFDAAAEGLLEAAHNAEAETAGLQAALARLERSMFPEK